MKEVNVINYYEHKFYAHKFLAEISQFLAKISQCVSKFIRQTISSFLKENFIEVRLSIDKMKEINGLLPTAF